MNIIFLLLATFFLGMGVGVFIMCCLNVSKEK